MLMSSIIFLSMDLELSKSACSGQISSGKLAGSQMRTIGLLKKKCTVCLVQKNLTGLQQHTLTFGRWRQEKQELQTGLSYTVSSNPSWVEGDQTNKKQNKENPLFVLHFICLMLEKGRYHSQTVKSSTLAEDWEWVSYLKQNRCYINEKKQKLLYLNIESFNGQK